MEFYILFESIGLDNPAKQVRYVTTKALNVLLAARKIYNLSLSDFLDFQLHDKITLWDEKISKYKQITIEHGDMDEIINN